MSRYYISFDSLSKSSLLGAMRTGISFNPSETDLVANYLCRKISDGILSPLEEALVQTCDLYGEEEPWQTWERLGGGREQEDLHLFTKLKLKSVNGARINRSVGTSGGYWHEEYSKPLKDLEFKGKIVNFQKKRFTYENPGSTQHCCWIMFEYKCSLSEEIVVAVLNKNKKRPAVNNKGRYRKICESFAEPDGTKHIPTVHDTTHQLVHIVAVQEAERSWESRVDDIIGKTFGDAFGDQTLTTILNNFFDEDGLL